MAQIYHDAQTVHLCNDLATKSAHSLMGIAATGRVAYIVIAIVTQRHIDDSTLGKVLQTLQLPINGKAIFYTQHNAVATLLFVRIQVCRCTGNTQKILILLDHCLNLVEDEVGILRRACHIKGNLRRKGLSLLGLRKIGHHDGSILMTLRHLVKINKNARITTAEIDALREKHGCIAMGIKSQNTLVQVTSLTIMGRLANQPGENGRAIFCGQTFRMPLNT